MKKELITDPFELLDQLVNIGKETTDIDITPEFKITISTFGSEDEADIFSIASKDTTQYTSLHKRETLVRAIIAINGKTLRDYEKIEDVKEYKAKKDMTNEKVRKIVSSWNENLVSFIYSEWYKLVSKSEKKLEEMKILEIIKDDEDDTEKKEEKK